VYSSDLERAYDSAKLALGFPNNLIKTDKRLREMYYGEEEGNHFDGLPQDQKDTFVFLHNINLKWIFLRINSLDYKPKGGETWPIAKARIVNFFGSVKNGNYLVFTHGGLMCSLTSNLGIDYIIPNCSCIGIKTDEQNLPDKIIFKWIYEEAKEL